MRRLGQIVPFQPEITQQQLGIGALGHLGDAGATSIADDLFILSRGPAQFTPTVQQRTLVEERNHGRALITQPFAGDNGLRIAPFGGRGVAAVGVGQPQMQQRFGVQWAGGRQLGQCRLRQLDSLPIIATVQGDTGSNSRHCALMLVGDSTRRCDPQMRFRRVQLIDNKERARLHQRQPRLCLHQGRGQLFQPSLQRGVLSLAQQWLRFPFDQATGSLTVARSKQMGNRFIEQPLLGKPAPGLFVEGRQ